MTLRPGRVSFGVAPPEPLETAYQRAHERTELKYLAPTVHVLTCER